VEQGAVRLAYKLFSELATSFSRFLVEEDELREALDQMA
jgi:hypothetical protein